MTASCRRPARAGPRFTEREIVPHLADWERAGEVPRELHRQAAARLGLLGVGVPRGGRRRRRRPARLAHRHRGDHPGRRLVRADRGAVHARHRAAAHRRGRRPGADRPVRPADAGRRADRRAGGHRARRRLGRGRAPHHRAAATATTTSSTAARPSSPAAARADFVTTAVRTGGPGHERHLAAGGRHGHARASPSPAGWTRWAGTAPTPPSCPSSTSACRRRTWSAPRAPASAQIMRHFASERISMAVQACATAQRCLDLTVAWCRERETFGAPLASRQVVRHRLAEMARAIDVARTYVRRVAARVATGERLVTEVAMAKNTAVAACDDVVDAGRPAARRLRLPARRRSGAALPGRPDHRASAAARPRS